MSIVSIHNLLILLAAVAIYSINPLLAQTEVDGEVFGEWTIEGSPYVVLEGTYIPSEETLVIQAGVEVLIRYHLLVQGNINAIGSEEDSILFYCELNEENPCQLLRFENNHDGRCVFRYTRIYDPNWQITAIWITDDCEDLEIIFDESYLVAHRFLGSTSLGSLTIRNCRVNSSRAFPIGQLVNIYSLQNIVIEDNTIFQSDIRIEDSDIVEICGNQFFENSEISIISVNEVTITNNRRRSFADEAMNPAVVTNNVVGMDQNSPRRDPNNIGSLVFTDNTFLGNWQFIGSGEGQCIIQRDSLFNGGLIVRGFEDSNVSDCITTGSISISGGEIENETCLIEGNTIANSVQYNTITIRGEGFSPVVRGNSGELTYLNVLDGATPEVYNNHFGWHANIDNAFPDIHHNVFNLTQNNDRILPIKYENNAGGVFSNNVILAWGYQGEAVGIHDGSDPIISNNIFYHNWDTNGVGIRSYGRSGAMIRYNIFFNFETNFMDIEPDDNNLFEDPLFAHVTPFDFRLQANSPAIDAGNPDFPEDPDGSRSDIGLVFYNQDQNNQPCITSPTNILVGYRDTLRYTAIAVDESEWLSFSFINLPDWLEPVEHRDYVSGSASIEGVVPEDEENFSFQVRCEDNQGAVDTLLVDVEISTHTLLHGAISGTLSTEDSPYWVCEPTWVEAGDSLKINPGCVIYLPMSTDNDPRPRLTFNIYGYLKCVGTDDDSIYFIGCDDRNAMLPSFYSGIDTSEIAYTRCTNTTGYSIGGTGTNLTIHNCLFSPGNMEDISVGDSSWLRVYDNVFRNKKGPFIAGVDSEIEVFKNVFYNDSTFEYSEAWWGWHCGSFRNCSVKSSENIFRNCGGAYRAYESGQLFSNNDTFLDCAFGFYLDNNETEIDHCFLSYIDYGPSFRSFSSNLNISNSIILSDTTGLIDELVEDGEIRFTNNLILTSDEISMQILEGFGVLSRINNNEDSVDTYGNLFGDAGLLNIYPLEYRLSQSSRCINAAIANDNERDPDGTLPDIGPIPFNHYNQTPHITRFYMSPEERGEIDELITCGVNFYDTDGDTSIFQWDLYNIIYHPDVSPTLIPIGVIGRTREINFMLSDNSEYVVRCMLTDGYRLSEIYWKLFEGQLLSEDELDILPQEFKLYQNFPNPFNSCTVVTFELPVSSHIKASIFDPQGRLVSILSDRMYPAGCNQLLFRADNLPSGVYICKMEAKDYNHSLKLILAK